MYPSKIFRNLNFLQMCVSVSGSPDDRGGLGAAAAASMQCVFSIYKWLAAGLHPTTGSIHYFSNISPKRLKAAAMCVLYQNGLEQALACIHLYSQSAFTLIQCIGGFV